MGLGQSDVDGYWKGQMVGAAVGAKESIPNARERERPRRILMRLEEDSGTVHGKFAQSSDVIAFRQLDNGKSRSVSTHTVTGTRDGPRVRMRFSGDAGLVYEIDATVSANSISGTYSAQYGPASPSADATEDGKFEVERY